ncbi:MAG: hypothetical protein AB201_03075 [Parcubacteria bacterium C7867-006]|nr:MAG: hypothetical protein AB201_03075 [Parcubacteria bacterium C7867-006]
MILNEFFENIVGGGGLCIEGTWCSGAIFIFFPFLFIIFIIGVFMKNPTSTVSDANIESDKIINKIFLIGAVIIFVGLEFLILNEFFKYFLVDTGLCARNTRCNGVVSMSLPFLFVVFSIWVFIRSSMGVISDVQVERNKKINKILLIGAGVILVGILFLESSSAGLCTNGSLCYIASSALFPFIFVAFSIWQFVKNRTRIMTEAQIRHSKVIDKIFLIAAVTVLIVILIISK